MNRIDEIDNILMTSNIDPDQFKMWKENIVTRRFMLEIEKDLLETRQFYISGESIESIALRAVRNSEHSETLEEVLEWIPSELVVE